MNLSTLISRAMVRFQDPDGHTFGEGEWRAYVNDAYADVLAARFDWPFMETRRTSVAAAAGASAVALPDDVWHVGAVFNATDGFALTPLHGRAEARRDFPSSDAAGAPTFYRIIGAQLELYPTPERATTLEIDAFAPPAELAAGTDEPAFPRQHHRILVDGALAYAHTTTTASPRPASSTGAASSRASAGSRWTCTPPATRATSPSSTAASEPQEAKGRILAPFLPWHPSPTCPRSSTRPSPPASRWPSSACRATTQRPTPRSRATVSDGTSQSGPCRA